MKLTTNNINTKLTMAIKSSTAKGASLFLLIVFGYVLLVAPMPTSAISRTAHCQSFSDDAARAACLTKLDQDTWNTCITAPEAQRGQCAQDYRNGQQTTEAQGQGESPMPEFQKNDCEGPNVQAGLDENDQNHCGILDYLVIVINVLSAAAGVIIVGSLIYAGIQYSMAGSDPQKVSASKDRIRNAIIALLFFIFGYALLNYLVPGGVL